MMGPRTLYTKRFRVMGGGGELRFVDDRGTEAAEAIARRAMEEAERIERKYSRYLPGSVISQINRNAGRTPVAVDPETVELVETALRLADLTGGAFAPTVGALRRVWNFKEERVPTREEVEALLPLVDCRQVSVRNGTVFLRREGMELDLGGIGKEYAVDRVAAQLRQEGVESAVVNLAGDLCTVGTRADGRPWKIGVQDPRERGKIRFAVRLMGDGGVASSGDYERFFVKAGVRYHHLLDARTGWPARGIASTTTLAPTAFEAGLAATASFLIGPESGLDYLERTAGLEGAIITEAGVLLATSGINACSDLPGSIYAEYPTL
jgi:FAD:protein FMN transferase